MLSSFVTLLTWHLTPTCSPLQNTSTQLSYKAVLALSCCFFLQPEILIYPIFSCHAHIACSNSPSLCICSQMWNYSSVYSIILHLMVVVQEYSFNVFEVKCNHGFQPLLLVLHCGRRLQVLMFHFWFHIEYFTDDVMSRSSRAFPLLSLSSTCA